MIFLLQERVEKEKLEKLNHMLQENICKSRTVHDFDTSSNTTDNNNNNAVSCNAHGRRDLDNEEIKSNKLAETSTPSKHHKYPQSCLQKCNNNGSVNAFNGNNSSRTQDQRVPIDNHDNRRLEKRFDDGTTDQRPAAAESLRYPMMNCDKQSNMNSDFQKTRSGVRCQDLDDNQTLSKSRQDKNGNLEIVTNHVQQFDDIVLPNDNYTSFDRNFQRANSNLSSTPKPLDLSTNFGYVDMNEHNSASQMPINLYNASISGKNDGVNEKEIRVFQAKKQPERVKSKATLNRHAEIQCGTPYVLLTDIQQHQPKYMSNVTSADLDNRNVLNIIGKTPRIVITGKPNESNGTSLKTPLVVITGKPTGNTNRGVNGRDLVRNKKLTEENDDNQIEDIESPVCQAKSLEEGNRRCFSKEIHGNSVENYGENYGEFVKPVALPPKSKARVTPLKGSHRKLPATSLPNANNNSEVGYESDTSIRSEFDLSLVRNINARPKVLKVLHKPNQNPLGKPSQIIRSQNNVRMVDRCVEGRARNEADMWTKRQKSPDYYQPIIPPRPAFSDCGTRRLVLANPLRTESVRSHCVKRRHSLDDSGIHSPPELLSHSPHKRGSPVDSKFYILRVYCTTSPFFVWLRLLLWVIPFLADVHIIISFIKSLHKCPVKENHNLLRFMFTKIKLFCSI